MIHWPISFRAGSLAVGHHYNDVMMTTMASQITSITVGYSTVYSDADQRKHQNSTSLAFVWGIYRTGEFPAQIASNAENVSIWWRHHDGAWWPLLWAAKMAAICFSRNVSTYGLKFTGVQRMNVAWPKMCTESISGLHVLSKPYGYLGFGSMICSNYIDCVYHKIIFVTIWRMILQI